MSHHITNQSERSYIRRKPLPTSVVAVLPFDDTNLEHRDTTSSPFLNSIEPPVSIEPDFHVDKPQPIIPNISTWAKLVHNTWSQEICGILISIACFVVLIILLLIFDGKPLSSWTPKITLGALISVLVTIMDAALALPLASGFGQLKWLLLNGQGQTLERIQQLDLASRSATGSINLLLSLQGGIIGSAGAIIAVSLLAVGPFSQQVLKYPQIQTLVSQSSIGQALNATEAVAQGGSFTTASLPMRAAIYNALLGFSTGGRLLDPPTNCTTGDCSWNTFDTLGICSTCTNITNLLQYSLAEEGDALQWSLPKQYNTTILGWLNQTTHPYSMLNLTSIPDQNWGPWPNASFLHFALVQNSLYNATEATALDCNLHYCLQEVDSNVSNGSLVENITDIEATWSLVSPDWRDMWAVPAKTNDSDTRFFVSGWAPSALANTMTPLLNGYARNTGDGGMMYASDILMAFWANRENVPDLMTYLVKSMSIHLREAGSGGSAQVTGNAYTTETYISVHWPWLILPATVIVLVLVFIFALMIETKRTKTRLWKNSMLALLFHGFDERSRHHILAGKASKTSNTIAGMNAIAEDTVVQLRKSEKDMALVLVSDEHDAQ